MLCVVVAPEVLPSVDELISFKYSLLEYPSLLLYFIFVHLPFLLITSTLVPFLIVDIILLLVLGPVLKFKFAVVVAYFDAASTTAN